MTWFWWLDVCVPHPSFDVDTAAMWQQELWWWFDVCVFLILLFMLTRLQCDNKTFGDDFDDLMFVCSWSFFWCWPGCNVTTRPLVMILMNFDDLMFVFLILLLMSTRLQCDNKTFGDDFDDLMFVCYSCCFWCPKLLSWRNSDVSPGGFASSCLGITLMSFLVVLPPVFGITLMSFLVVLPPVFGETRGLTWEEGLVIEELTWEGQIECQKICQIEWQKICQIECQKVCQVECQKICQIECQKICQKE